MKHFFLIIVVAFFSCNHSSESNENSQNISKRKTNKLVKKSEMKYQIDNSIDYFITNLYSSEINNNEIFHFYHQNSHSVFLYNLNEQQYFKKISFKKEGPNAVKEIFGYYLHNTDTIYLVLALQNNILQLNFDGNMVNSFSSEGINLNTGFYSTSWDNTRAFKNDEFYYFFNHFMGYTGNLTYQDIRNLPVLYKMQLNKTVLNEVNIKFSVFNENIPASKQVHYFGAFNSHTKDLVLSSPYSENVYTLKLGKDTVFQPRKIASENIDFDEDFFNQDAPLEAYLEKPSYHNVVYDKYRNVYYRFVYLGRKIKTTDNLQQANFYRSPFSVIVFDSNFNILGETIFPDNTYQPKVYFVCEQGLAIATVHYNNPNLDENYLTFDVFELTE